MPNLGNYESLFLSISQEWNKAEKDIKQAEQINHKIVTPSIKELRYAGRRIVEAIVAINFGSADADILKLLGDAEFDCMRARHDAIDAGTADIAKNLVIMVDKLGYNAILKAYPGFALFYNKLVHIRDKIVESRGKRENRNDIYGVIEDVDFPSLVSDYNQIQACEPIMKRLARQERVTTVVAYGFGIAGVIGVLVTVIAWKFPDLLK